LLNTLLKLCRFLKKHNTTRS